MKQETIHKGVLLGLVAAVSLLFLHMIAPFLLAIVMAALFAALTHPLYLRLQQLPGVNRYLASLLNLLLLLFIVLIPLSILLAVFVGQAVNVGKTLTPLVVKALQEPGTLGAWLQDVPFHQYLVPYEEQIAARMGQAVEAVGRLLVGGLSSVAIGTANFFFTTLVFLYSLFFFQVDGPKVMERVLYYLPLNDTDERRMLDKFTSVTRAMVKGTLLIGLLQGALAGVAFAIAGVGNAVFWGTVMAVLSILPGIGSAAVWVPASIVLLFQGQILAGTALMLFCGLVVGSVDNVLRPRLVGKDTNMHELMIFFGTLGGLFTFGMAGLFIGPVVASLFLTIWELYGVAFQDMLPAVGTHAGLAASGAEGNGRTPVDRAAAPALFDGDDPQGSTDQY
jgi:predicted PurR-regulated permease PerM